MFLSVALTKRWMWWKEAVLWTIFDNCQHTQSKKYRWSSWKTFMRSSRVVCPILWVVGTRSHSYNNNSFPVCKFGCEWFDVRLIVLSGTDVKHDIMCHDVATLKNCKTIALRCQTKPRCYENPWIRYFDQISARPNCALYPRIRSCNSVKRLNFSSNSYIRMENMQKVTNINHVKFDIRTLDNMEVTRTFMFNLHIQTILAKIMWDKFAECTASTIDQFFTWKQTFFGPNPTFTPSPHAILFVRKGLPMSRPTLHRGGEGGSERILQQFGKKALCPTHFGQDCSCMCWKTIACKYGQHLFGAGVFHTGSYVHSGRKKLQWWRRRGTATRRGEFQLDPWQANYNPG